MKNEIKLFCYGSNSVQQLKERLEKINIKYENGYIQDHVRIFCGISRKWNNGGIASIFPCYGKRIYGIIVYLTLEDIEKLNNFEKGYHLEKKKAILQKKLKNTEINIITYVKDNNNFCFMPSIEYLFAINQMLNDRNNTIKNRIIFIRAIINNKLKIIGKWNF
jgi:hypothetical protein